MTRFTDGPYEQMMMEIPRPQKDYEPAEPPAGHPCRGCKRYGEGCVLPCYRGVKHIPDISLP